MLVLSTACCCLGPGLSSSAIANKDCPCQRAILLLAFSCHFFSSNPAPLSIKLLRPTLYEVFCEFFSQDKIFSAISILLSNAAA